VTDGTDNWNQAPAQSIRWLYDDVIDTAVFSHSTSTDSHLITVNSAGNYLLIYNDSLTSGQQRPNPRVQVLVNGSPVAGAETKCHYIRNGSPGVDNESSGTLVFLLNDLSAGDAVSLETNAETTITGAVTADEDALLLLWRKP
jgi:hypothetical protein